MPFKSQPSDGDRVKGRVGSPCRPCAQLTATGKTYDRLRAETDAELMALKALVDMMKIRPRRMVTRVVK